MLRDTLTSLAVGFAITLSAMAEAATVPEPLSVSDWAVAKRVVSADSGSPSPGRWSHDRAPWSVEIMDAMGYDNITRTVVVRGSAQSTKSECALNAVLSCIDQTPVPIMVVLPSTDEARKWNQVKFECSVRESDGVRHKVLTQAKASSEGSTASRKRFPGGYLQIASAGTSKNFQMITIGFMVFEEIEEYEDQAGTRGDVLEQGRARGLEFGDDFKEIIVSTTGEKGNCKTTEEFLRGTREYLHVPCPHCEDFYALTFDRLVEVDGRGGMACPGCGGIAESYNRFDMIERARWVARFVHKNEDKHPLPPEIIPAAEIERWANRWRLRPERRSFQIWRGMTKTTSWDKILAKKIDIEAGRGDAKVFCQQYLAEPFEAVTERPDWEKLFNARGKIHRKAGEVPSFCAFLTGAVDVQHDRLEWAVYGWGRGGIGARIATGEIEGDPSDPATWGKLQDFIINSEWSGPRFKPARPLNWAVDSGYATQDVYKFCHRLKAYGVYPVKGVDGKKGHEAPAFAQGTTRKIKQDGRTVGRIKINLIGIHNLKDRVYFGLAAGHDSNEGPLLPRSLVYPKEATEEDFKQLTAEVLKRDDPRYKAGVWTKVAGQANEQLDLAVYNLALAIKLGLDRWKENQWLARYEDALPESATLAGDAPLEALWQDPAHVPPEAIKPAPAPPRSENSRDWLAKLRERNKANG